MKEPAEFCDFALFSIAVMRQCEFCPLSKGKKKKKVASQNENKMSTSPICCIKQP